MRTANVSFIIPVYSVERFLPCCLDSVLNQTVKDIEVICIDDCSPDKSLQVLEEYAARDPRVKIISFNENKGPGAARNAGLDTVSGEFVRMVDGDDFVPPDSTEKMLEAAEKYGSDFVRGGFRNCSFSSEILGKGWNFPAQLAVNTSIRDDQTLWRFDQHWAYLYRARPLLASGSRYDESMRNGQDAAFLVDLLPYLEKVTSIPDTVYYYRENPRSIMRRKREKQFYLNVLSLYQRAYKRLGKIDVREAADYIFYQALRYYLPDKILSTVPDNLNDKESKEVLAYLHSILKEQDGEKLCFVRPYSWQAKQQIPWPSRYLVLLLCEGYLDDALDAIKHIKLNKAKEQHLQEKIKAYKDQLETVYSSTSWRMTEPVRKLGKMIKNRA